MPLSDSDLRVLQPKDNRYKVSIGDALHIEVYPNGVDQIQDANTNRIIAAGKIKLKTFVYQGKSIELKSIF